jgi:hypothetical protein
MAQVIQHGPWLGDMLQQTTARHAAVQQLQAQGATFHSSPVQAHKSADAIGGMVHAIPGVKGAKFGADKWVYAILGPGSGSASGGGSGIGGTAGGAGASAPGAVQAGLPTPGPGGPRFQLGANNVSDFLPERGSTFDGIDTFTPPEKLGTTYSPDATNWDDFEKYGSYCVRRGSAKLQDDRESLNVDYFNIVCVANSSLTASTDYITFTETHAFPAGATHAFWFDTTGADSEPAGSVAADTSVEVTTTAMTAAQVATTLAAAINTADIGLVAFAVSTAVHVFVIEGTVGTSWTLAETVTNAGFTVTPVTPTSMDSVMRGLSISRIPGNSNGPDYLLIAFAENGIGSASSTHPISLHVCKSYPKWGRPKTLKGIPGPKLTLSQVAGPQLRVVTDYTNVFDGSSTGTRANSVTHLIVRYSTLGYPSDLDGQDYLATASTALVNRGAWTGASRTDDTATVGGLVVGVYYVSAWAVSRQGYSERSIARLEIT